MITPRTLQILEHTLRSSQGAVDSYTERMHQFEPTMRAFVDEIALLVTGGQEMQELCRALPSLGWEKFNGARDRVRTSPIPSNYDVQYTFFRHPEKTWRLEVMKMISGYSPLHGAIRQPIGGEMCVPVHASFKCPDEESYAYAVGSLEGSAEYMLAQRCDSTYGRFSYWTTLDRGDFVPYLKPRVNLRDNNQPAIF